MFRPACRYHRPCFGEPFGLNEARGLSIDSRVLPRANPLHSHQVFSPMQCWMLPWVFSLSGIFIDRLDQSSPTSLLSHAWSPAWLPTRSVPASQSISCGLTCPTRKGRTSLSGFWHLSIPGVRAWYSPIRAMCSPCKANLSYHKFAAYALDQRRLYLRRQGC